MAATIANNVAKSVSREVTRYAAPVATAAATAAITGAVQNSMQQRAINQAREVEQGSSAIFMRSLPSAATSPMQTVRSPMLRSASST